MTNIKVIAMRGVNAVVVLGTIIFVIGGIVSVFNYGIGDWRLVDRLLALAIYFVSLFAICAAGNYVFFGKATVWNKPVIESP